MMMPSRKYSSGTGYRYGFNGKENDNEVKGEGNQQDYGNRIYDPRLGRFTSVDPLANDYPYYSPYQYAGNSPIELIDIDGSEGGKIIQAIKDFSDAVTDFFTFKSEKEEIKAGVDNMAGGVNKQVIGPWNAYKIYTSENPGLEIAKMQADGYIQGITGVVQVSSGVQGISNKVQTVVEVPLIIKDLSQVSIKKGTSNAVKGSIKPEASPQATSTYKMSESVPEWKGPVDYTTLPEPRNVGPGKKFTRTQHTNIMEHNKKVNGGVLRDDETGQILNPAKQDKKGVPSDMNSAQLDHKNARKPKDKTKTPGSNSNSNASVRSKAGNIKKSNN
ncbi:MAG: hypothetical protein KF829_05030 [Ferruginibacter sp.]|nr:hypothetical protein [Ferruginibacter sp.]